MIRFIPRLKDAGLLSRIDKSETIKAVKQLCGKFANELLEGVTVIDTQGNPNYPQIVEMCLENQNL